MTVAAVAVAVGFSSDDGFVVLVLQRNGCVKGERERERGGGNGTAVCYNHL